MAKKRILFVDDEPNVLQGLRRILHGQSDMWELFFAEDAKSAKDLLLQMAFDVVVLDVNMPGQDGMDLLVEIKSDERTHGLEVILLTGVDNDGLRHEAIDLGAIDLLRKPVTQVELLARLRSALRTKGYRDELLERNILLEEELLRSQKVELAGLLAAGAAHDLNNILTAIVGYSSLAIGRASDGGIQQNLAAVATKIEKAGLRAARIVQQIVDFAKKNHKGAIQLISLPTMISECVDMLQVSIPHGVRIIVENEAKTGVIRANETEIYQALMNLCINGVQAMGHQGTLRIGLREIDADDQERESPRLMNPHVELSVSDTGTGIDADTLNKVFRSGFTTKGGGGCGLGLSVVQRIVTKHKGQIEVHSDVGKGTVFRICLPIDGTDTPADCTV